MENHASFMKRNTIFILSQIDYLYFGQNLDDMKETDIQIEIWEVRLGLNTGDSVTFALFNLYAQKYQCSSLFATELANREN